jgi:hypothetical protein
MMAYANTQTKVAVATLSPSTTTVTHLILTSNMTNYDDHAPATRTEKKRQGKTGGTPFSAKHVRAAAALQEKMERPVLVPAAEVKRAGKKHR